MDLYFFQDILHVDRTRWKWRFVYHRGRFLTTGKLPLPLFRAGNAASTDRIRAHSELFFLCVFQSLSVQTLISDYSKAIRDTKGEAELLTYFVECGHKFTLYYGDIDEDFDDSLMEVYGQAIKKVLTLPDHEQGNFRERLKKIMLSSSGIGWGYHDGLCDDYYGSFQTSD